MELIRSDSCDSDGRLYIVEDESRPSSPSSSRDESRDYEIDIVDTIDGCEIHVESLSQEEVDKDVMNLIKENANIDIMSLPFVYAEDFNANDAEDTIAGPKESIFDGLHQSLLIIPSEIPKIEEEKIVFAESVSTQTEIGRLQETSPKLKTKWKENNKKKYYICLNGSCLFNNKFGRFDTKQKFKTHLWNEHWVRDKKKLEKKANLNQVIVRTASQKTENPEPSDQHDVKKEKNKPAKEKKGRKKDKPAKEKKAIQKMMDLIKKSQKLEVGDILISKNSEEFNFAGFDLGEGSGASPAVSFVCTRDDCQSSNPSFETEGDFKAHIQQCHCKINSESKTEPETNPIYNCKSCDILFKSKKDLERHSLLHGLNDPLTCKICKVQFKTTDQLDRHKEEKHNELMHKCERCGLEFRFRIHLLQHLRSVHSKEVPVLCPICDKGFRSKAELQEHAEEIHKIVVEIYKCEICERVFNKKMAIATHIAKAHQEKGSGEKKIVGKKKSVGKKKNSGKKRTNKLNENKLT